MSQCFESKLHVPLSLLLFLPRYGFFSLQSEKLLLYDTVQSELEEKIRRLEEDRHSIDITSGRDQVGLAHMMTPSS